MKVSTKEKKGNPKGDKNKEDSKYGSKSLKPQKKELKFMPLGIISQHKFDLEQLMKSFPRDTFCTIMRARWLQCAPYQLPAF
jgi:hypothetical protein